MEDGFLEASLQSFKINPNQKRKKTNLGSVFLRKIYPAKIFSDEFKRI